MFESHVNQKVPSATLYTPAFADRGNVIGGAHGKASLSPQMKMMKTIAIVGTFGISIPQLLENS